VLALLPAGAAASVTPITLRVSPHATQFGRVAGPAFAGDALVFGRPTSDAYEVVSRRGPEAVARVAIPTVPAKAKRFVYADVEASSERVVLDLHVSACLSGDCLDGSTRLLSATFTGPLGGELEPVAGCLSRAECAAEPCIRGRSDVSGNTIAYTGCDGALRVRDLAPGANPAGRDFPDLGGVARVAGDYVAAERPGEIAVVDWTTGDEQYAVDHDSSVLFDLQPDGKLAYAPHSGSAAWASRTEPVPHPVAHDRSYLYQLRMGGDRIAARRDLPDSPFGQMFEFFELDTNPSPDTETEWVGDRAALPGFDFDGSRLAWIAKPCHQAFILVSGEPGGLEIDRGLCPFPRVVPGSAWMSRDRRVRLALACPSQPPRGCTGSIVPGGDRSRGVNYSFRAGGRKTVRLSGFPKACRRRSGRIRVKVVLLGWQQYRLRTVNARGKTEGLPRCD
jgi:hypothetical protein